MVKSVLMKCPNCGRYTLSKDKCPVCGSKVIVPHPPKFSPEDKYGKYRLLMKIMTNQIQVSEELKRKVIEKYFLQVTQSEGEKQEQTQSTPQ